MCGVLKYCTGMCHDKNESDCESKCRESNQNECFRPKCLKPNGEHSYKEHNCYHCTNCIQIRPPPNPESCWTQNDNCCLSLEGCYTLINITGIVIIFYQFDRVEFENHFDI